MNAGGSFLKLLICLLGLLVILGCGQEFELQTDPTKRPRVEFNSSEIKYDPEYVDYSDVEFPEKKKDGFGNDEKQEAGDEQSPFPSPSPSPFPPISGGEPVDPIPTNPNDPSSPPQQDLSKPLIGVGSVYYIPVLGENRKCKETEISLLKDINEKTLATLCKSEIIDCRLQGSCYYVSDSKVTLFSYRKFVKIKDPRTKTMISQPRFVVNKLQHVCPQGMGVANTCLDPYRSIAADRKFHKRGDVIYIPKLRGQKLPNGELHDGYFVVRDIGGAINNEGRFDFFIGFDDYRGHVFSKLNLSSPKTSRFYFYRVNGYLAQQVREARRFPLAPEKVKSTAQSHLGKIILGQVKPPPAEAQNVFYQLKFKLD